MSRSKRALLLMLVITASALGACHEVPIIKEPTSFATGEADIEGFVPEQPSVADLKRIAGDTKLENIIREVDGRVTFFYYMKHRAADAALINILKTKLGHHKVPGKITSHPHLNMLIITDAEENIEAVKQMLRRLDHPQNQVLIKVRVVEMTSTKKLEVGFNLVNDLTHASRALLRSFKSVAQPSTSMNYLEDNPTGSWQGSLFRFAVLGKDMEKWGNLSLIIRALEQAGYAKILSRPSIRVTQNSSASISTGDDIPIQSVQIINNVLSITTSFKSTGVTLTVKPTFIGDESVILDVNPDVSTVVRYVSQSIQNVEVQIPIIATRRASTKVALNNDETLTIGGLVRHSDRVSETRIPLLGSIPYLGYLFRSTEKEEYYTELYFILHVQIIKGESSLSEYMHRGFGTPPAKKTEPTGDDKQPKKTPRKPEDKKGGETKKPDDSPKPPPPEPQPAKPKTP